MNRRGFLRAAGATGLMLTLHGPAAGLIFGPSVEQRLRQALAEQRLVAFRYHGFPRLVEAHALGHIRDHRLALLGWQVAGGSASEPPPGWRIFVVAEISALKLARENFDVRPDYRPATTRLRSVEAEISSLLAGRNLNPN